MGITSIIALLILSSGLTGATMTVLWIIFYRLVGKYFSSNIIYLASKIVIASYYIPSMFIILMVQDKVMEIENMSFLFFTQIIKIILSILFGVAFVLFLQEIKKVKIKYNKLDNICGNRIPAEIDINNLKKDISDRLHIKHDVRLYIGYSVPCPFTYGIVKPAIYLPPEKIDKMHLQVLLTHELFHNKQRDYIWKPLSMLTRCIHWINPFVWIASRSIERWSESSCDLRCCTKGEIDSDTYFNYLKKTLDSLSELSRKYILGLEGDGKEFIWRNKRFEINEHLKKNKIISIFISVCILLLGCLSIYKMAYVVNRGYYKVFMITAEMYRENWENEESEWDEEIITIDEIKEWGIESCELDSSNSSGDTGLINETIKSGVVYLSQQINLKEESTFRIYYTIDSEKEDISIGILQPDGVIRYISCSEYINYDFNITQTGKYKIYVYNSSGEDVDIFISYAY